MSSHSKSTARPAIPQRLAPVLLAMLTLSAVQPTFAIEAPAARAAFRQVEMADVIAAAQPAVVKIDVTKTVGGIARLDGRALPFGDGSPLPDFLRRFGIPGQGEPQRGIGLRPHRRRERQKQCGNQETQEHGSDLVKHYGSAPAGFKGPGVKRRPRRRVMSRFHPKIEG